MRILKYTVVAYADPECGLKKRKVSIEADNHKDAEAKAWDMFPEYHEVGVYEE